MPREPRVSIDLTPTAWDLVQRAIVLRQCSAFDLMEALCCELPLVRSPRPKVKRVR